MNQEIFDTQLLHFLQREIGKLPDDKRKMLNSIAHCGKQVVIPKTGRAGVFVLHGEGDSALFGVGRCQNTFACPCCSAHRMSIYAGDIAVGLDLMRSKGYFGFMITFTVAHLAYMSCRETTDILYNTYRYYRQSAKEKVYGLRKDGTAKEKTGTIAKQFYQDCKIEHSVTVCEYTWGKNGWHPHFHAIFWTKRENKDKIMKWQDKLRTFWLEQAQRCTLAYWNKHKLHFGSVDERRETVKNLYAKSADVAGLIISNTDGEIRESLSSDYVAGWGANREITGNYRKEASHDGHYTPYQILKAAHEGDKAMLKLYLDFCIAVRTKPVHHRVIWSRGTGIKTMINVAKQQTHFRELIKKKSTVTHWEVLLWFTKEQWYSVWLMNKQSPVIANILYIARYIPKELSDFLNGLGLEHMTTEHEFGYLVEEIFNEAA